MTNPIGLYIHIPFCRQRCDFCAFYLELHREPAARTFLAALTTEIAIRAEQEGIRDQAFQSVYFGGGTPTSLQPDQLIAILGEIRRHLPLIQECEVTLEAHPATVTNDDLSRLREAGVNRISLGVESMQDKELIQIGRPVLAHETVNAVQAARQAGFSNINLDVMYGLPNQTVESWASTLRQCLELAPTHLSCYALTVEEGTRLAHDIRHGRTQPPDESLQVAMDQQAQTILREAGYPRYELSNYAKPGFACKHNLLYWTAGDYLGLGPSAQSFVRGSRFGNIANLAAYQAALGDRTLPTDHHVALTEQEQMRDAVIFGLRLTQGIPTDRLHSHAANYGHMQTVARLREQRLIEEEGSQIRLSAQGQRHADTVADKLY